MLHDSLLKVHPRNSFSQVLRNISVPTVGFSRGDWPGGNNLTESYYVRCQVTLAMLAGVWKTCGFITNMEMHE